MEGFSNPLWVLLMAASLVVSPVGATSTLKVMSVAFTCATLLVVRRILSELGVVDSGKLLVLTLLAMCTPFVTWSVSGLENPLYAFLIMALALVAVLDAREAQGCQRARVAGMLAAGVALTRPEGILFSFPYAVLLMWRSSARRLDSPRTAVMRYLSWLVMPVGAYMAFRVAYYGELVSNTYFAKGASVPASAVGLAVAHQVHAAKLLELGTAVAGMVGGWLLPSLGVAVAFLAGRGRLDGRHGALGLFLLTATGVYALLPGDWMPEYRLATPVFPIFFCLAAAVVSRCTAGAPAGTRHRAWLLASWMIAMQVGLAVYVPRSLAFRDHPPVPFAQIQQQFGYRFNRIAERLGVHGGSVLLPDIGGTLWVSDLRVYDLAGLTEPSIAKTLWRKPQDPDRQGFMDLVFAKMKPTFIHTHEYWAMVPRFDLDPRFRQEYVPIREKPDQWVSSRSCGQTVPSGDYVRVADVVGKDAVLAEIRAEALVW